MTFLQTFLFGTVFFFSLSAHASDSATPIDISLPETVFTDPINIVKAKPDTAIRDKLIQLIDAATKGSSIHFMIFMFDDTAIEKALLKAQSRGVKVHVLMDWTGRGRDINRTAYEALKGKLSQVIQVAHPLGISHNKLALFSAIQTNNNNQVQKHIIFESSSNFVTSSYQKFQDALILQDKTLFVDGFMSYWHDIVKQNTAKGLQAYHYREQAGSVTLSNGKPVYEAYFFPKRRDNQPYGSDNVVLILDKLIKQTQAKETSVNLKLAMSLWTQSRETKEKPNILSRLKRLAKQPKNTIDILLPEKKLNRYMIGKLNAFAQQYQNVRFSTVKQNLHSKYMLVKVAQSNKNNQYSVYSGSANFTEPALRKNFETWIKTTRTTLNKAKVYKAYLQNFNAIQASQTH